MLPQAQLQELLQAQQILQVLPQALNVRPLLQPPPLLPALPRVLLPALPWVLLQAQLSPLQALPRVLLQAQLSPLRALPRVLLQAQLSLLRVLPQMLLVLLPLLLQGPALRRIPRHLPRSQQKPQGFRRIPAQKP